MRTLFEDTDVRADIEDAREQKNFSRLPLILWIVAIGVFGGSWQFHHWARNRKPPAPPPAAASLDDSDQVNTLINQFNGFIKQDNWGEAQKLLASAGQQRLDDEKKSLRESLLAERKDDKVVEALITPSRTRTPSTVRVDCAYLFPDSQNKIIPLTVVLENNKLAINSW
jgi:hypothetical protein